MGNITSRGDNDGVVFMTSERTTKISSPDGNSHLLMHKEEVLEGGRPLRGTYFAEHSNRAQGQHFTRSWSTGDDSKLGSKFNPQDPFPSTKPYSPKQGDDSRLKTKYNPYEPFSPTRQHDTKSASSLGEPSSAGNTPSPCSPEKLTARSPNEDPNRAVVHLPGVHQPTLRPPNESQISTAIPLPGIPVTADLPVENHNNAAKLLPDKEEPSGASSTTGNQRKENLDIAASEPSTSSGANPTTPSSFPGNPKKQITSPVNIQQDTSASLPLENPRNSEASLADTCDSNKPASTAADNPITITSPIPSSVPQSKEQSDSSFGETLFRDGDPFII